MQNEQGLYGINPTRLVPEVLVFLTSQCRFFAEQFTVIQLIKAILRFAIPKYLFIYLVGCAMFPHLPEPI